MTEQEIELKQQRERYDDISENSLQFLNDKKAAAEKQNKTMLIIAGCLSLVVFGVVVLVTFKKR